MNEIIFADYVVVCRSEQCSNSGITLTVKGLATDPVFVCGVCQQQITEVEPAPKEDL